MAQAQQKVDHPTPLRFKHEITVVEEIKNPTLINIDKLPPQTKMSLEGDIFQGEENPDVTKFKETFGE